MRYRFDQFLQCLQCLQGLLAVKNYNFAMDNLLLNKTLLRNHIKGLANNAENTANTADSLIPGAFA